MARNMLTGKGGDERERERGRKKKKKKSEPCLRDFRIRAVIHIGLSLIMGQISMQGEEWMRERKDKGKGEKLHRTTKGVK